MGTVFVGLTKMGGLSWAVGRGGGSVCAKAFTAPEFLQFYLDAHLHISSCDLIAQNPNTAAVRSWGDIELAKSWSVRRISQGHVPLSLSLRDRLNPKIQLGLLTRAHDVRDECCLIKCCLIKCCLIKCCLIKCCLIKCCLNKMLLSPSPASPRQPACTHCCMENPNPDLLLDAGSWNQCFLLRYCRIKTAQCSRRAVVARWSLRCRTAAAVGTILSLRFGL